MRSKLTALLAGLVLLGLAGTARAEALASPEVQALTLPAVTDTWSLPSTGTEPASSTDAQVVTLTDTQLDNVTAGAWWYYGWRWFRFYAYNRYWQYYAPLWLWY
jgi:hypothetical protein